MRRITLSLTATVICCTAMMNANAQQRQGAGHAAGLGSTTGTNVGLSKGPNISTAQGQGAIRSVGRGNSGSASVGAQLSTSGSTSGGGTSATVRTNQQSRADTSRGMSLQARGRAEMVARGRRDASQNNEAATKTKSGSEQTSAGRDDRANGAPWTREGISRADWLLAIRLASIDHMRDEALVNGNERMLDQADKLEARARLQYEHRTGEFADDSSGSQTSIQSSTEAAGTSRSSSAQ
jgi:hypothetical protein